MQFDWTVRVTDLVMIAAVFLGPIVAVRLTEWLRHQKEFGQRRDGIFRTLMATRNATLAPVHVEALNLVDVLFHKGTPQDRKVVDAWRLYLSHLNDHNYPKDSWAARRAELLVELLFEMGVALGYSFDKSQIKSGAYYPGGYSDAELDQLEARKLWLEVLRGRRQLPMRAEVYGPHEQRSDQDQPTPAQIEGRADSPRQIPTKDVPK